MQDDDRKKTTASTSERLPGDADGRDALDPGPNVVDPAPWMGQVGEGATLESGEIIAREAREMLHPESTETGTEGETGSATERPISADPEMPIPSPDDDREVIDPRSVGAPASPTTAGAARAFRNETGGPGGGSTSVLRTQPIAGTSGAGVTAPAGEQRSRVASGLTNGGDTDDVKD